ncbi:MAG: N-acetylmuramoyl-L-alanine amidase [Eubacteriales bacterium]|nr:N-acetylmuramoyl-L-alanine amidase [Eubacteriales bacterium]
MPSVFLSPSTQEYNPYVINGGSEEYYMNLIADAMIPYLNASGISYGRNDPAGNVSTSIASSNAGDFDVHLAIHSNASPPNMQGAYRGPDVYYYTYSPKGKQLAEIITANLKEIYPLPELTILLPNNTLAELRRTRAPAVLVEVAYHDNYDDARWIQSNIDSIARNLVLSLTEYFGIPFVNP